MKERGQKHAMQRQQVVMMGAEVEEWPDFLTEFSLIVRNLHFMVKIGKHK